MERSVEAGDLRKLRQSLEQRTYWRQVVRLMQRRERYVFLERADHGRIEAHRLRVLESAVNDAMSDTDEPMLGELVAEKTDEMFERAIMTELDAVAPCLLGDDRAAAVLGDEARRRVQTFRLPARDERHAIRLLRKQRELEARRARVQDGDRIGHVIFPLRDRL